MKVLYITNIPSPYVVSFLNELGKKSELVALFERDESKDRDKSWRNFKAAFFEYKILNGIKYGTDKAACFEVVKYLKKYKDYRIILSNPVTLTGIIAIHWLKKNKIPYSLQVEGGMEKNGKGIKERIKKYLFSGASHYYSSGKITDRYLMFYGAHISKISHFPFTSIYESDVLNCPISMEEKKAIKEKLGISNNFTVITVGSYIYRKGIDVLIRALGLCDNKINAIIIGGTPTNEYLSLVQKNGLKNVMFLPFMSKCDVLKYLRAADLFVMPTRYDIWGLVINEAMSQGLPIVSSNKCVAALELINKQTGFIFNSEDYQELSNIINYCFINQHELCALSKNSLNTARNYTYEKMALAHLGNWPANNEETI